MPPFPTPTDDEAISNFVRRRAAEFEPRSIRTFTPSQAVIAKSAGIFHWTVDGRRLFDFTSGVLVANLGHNPVAWTERFFRHLGWDSPSRSDNGIAHFRAAPLTAYNAITPLEVEASSRLITLLRARPGGARMEQVLWAASGSEAIQKALWAALAFDRTRPMILASRHGFHGKKGLSNAVTGGETDAERDPRVKFFSFPQVECCDLSKRDEPFDPLPYRKELDELFHQFGRKLGALITEPYLGGGGSYHPHPAYLQMLQAFCREHEIVFILDEVQSNFGRCSELFAFESYGLEPDLVVLGKGLGNGVPVAAVCGRAELFRSLDYGEASDTWSANPLSSAAVIATLEQCEARDPLGIKRIVSRKLEAGLVELKRFPFIVHVRGERDGMVWGIEFRDHGRASANEWANRFVFESYRAGETEGVHLLGPLAKKVVRIAPPLIITEGEVEQALKLMNCAAENCTPPAPPR